VDGDVDLVDVLQYTLVLALLAGWVWGDQ